MEEVYLVRAVYEHVKSNTDELNFRRGDVITVTQRVEGGWWEGTLRGETGWFPTSFVVEYRPEHVENNGVTQNDPRREYRAMVLRNLVESERKHVAEMQMFQKNYLRPLKAANLLPESDYLLLCGNFDEIIQLHSKLVEHCDDILRSPSEQQAVGAFLMKTALELKSVHVRYCSNHPRAVQILNQYKETLNAFCGPISGGRSGVMVLTSELSRPFRRLDKYPNMLQELERHLEEFHFDRGNTQRAVMVYTEIAAVCAEARRQKEIELEIVHGNIKDYQGPEIDSLGEVVLMAPIGVRDEPGGAKQERYLVLFEDCLLMLAASPRMSCFMYMSHSSLSGLKLRPVDTPEMPLSFEVWGKTLDRKIVECRDRETLHKWLETLSSQIYKSSARPPIGKSNTLPKPSKVPLNGTPSNSPKVSSVREAPPLLSPRGQRFKPPIITNPLWSGSCLRPYPPLRPELPAKEERLATVSQSPKLPRKFSTRRSKEQAKTPKPDEPLSVEKVQQYENDALLLGVIDAYSISSKTRHKVTSEVFDSPHVLIAEEEKIIIEGSHGNSFEEKSLVDTVYAMRDEIRDLSTEVVKLRRALNDEQKARKQLEMSWASSRQSINGEKHSERFS